MEKTLCGERKNQKRNVNGGLDEKYVLMMNELNLTDGLTIFGRGARGDFLSLISSPVSSPPYWPSA